MCTLSSSAEGQLNLQKVDPSGTAHTGKLAERRLENPWVVARQAVLIDAFVLVPVCTEETRMVDSLDEALHRGLDKQ